MDVMEPERLIRRSHSSGESVSPVKDRAAQQERFLRSHSDGLQALADGVDRAAERIKDIKLIEATALEVEKRVLEDAKKLEAEAARREAQRQEQIAQLTRSLEEERDKDKAAEIASRGREGENGGVSGTDKGKGKNMGNSIGVTARITTFLAKGKKEIRRAKSRERPQGPAPVIRTPGFIMLQRLYKMTEPQIFQEAEAFEDAVAGKYREVKAMRTKLAKRGPDGMLTGKMKRRAELVLMLRAAIEAVMATQANAGPDLLRSVRKMVQAKLVLDQSQEKRALILLQASMRMAMPVTEVNQGLPVLQRQQDMRRSLEAHRCIQRVARARVSSDVWLLSCVSIRDHVWMARRRGEDEARDAIRRFYAHHRPVTLDAGTVLSSACKTSFANSWWSSVMRAAVLLSTSAKATLERRRYRDAPAMAGIVLGFFPQAKATSFLGIHLCRCAKHHLSLGAFAHASALLAEASEQVTLAEAKAERRRRNKAQKVICRAALKFYARRMTKAAKLKKQLREAERNVREQIKAGARGRQVKVLKDTVVLLRKQVLQAIMDQEQKTREQQLQQRGKTGGSERASARRPPPGGAKRRRLVMWNPDQVADWLGELLMLEAPLMAPIQKIFITAGVDGMTLINLSSSEMVEMGIQIDYAKMIESGADVELDAALALRGVEVSEIMEEGEEEGPRGDGAAIERQEFDSGDEGQVDGDDVGDGDGNVGDGDYQDKAGDDESRPSSRASSSSSSSSGDDHLPMSQKESTQQLHPRTDDGNESASATAAAPGVTLPPIAPNRVSPRRGSCRGAVIGEEGRESSVPAWRAEAEAKMRAKNRNRRNPSPRIWTATLEPQGARVQQAGGLQVGTLPLKNNEERQAQHSFDETGCLCQHNWLCPRCFVWNRAETRYDLTACVWCFAEPPPDYHPPTWKGGIEFGTDSRCPAMLAILAQRGIAGRKTDGDGAEARGAEKVGDVGKENGGNDEGATLRPAVVLPAIKLTSRPRESYPRMPMHPPLGTMRDAGDAARVDEEWQAAELGLDRMGAVMDIGRDQFEEDDLEVKERSGALASDEQKPTGEWNWNPVDRFVASSGYSASREMALARLKPRPVSALHLRQKQLIRQRIGVKRNDFFS